MDAKTRWNNWIAGVKVTDWLLVALTAALAVVAVYQWQAARATILQNERVNRDSRRAYVGIASFTALDPDRTPHHTQRLSPAHVIQLINSGLTPAKHVRFSGRLEMVPAGMSPNFETYTSHKNSSILFPGGKLSQSSPPIEPFDEILESSLRRRTYTYFHHGKIDYIDVFGAEHWTKFCYYLSPIDGEWSPCEEHNEID